ncbi:hypothetical protein GCM10007981_17380 [Thermocladium modestius]|uniref:Uncharacterized protein n=1 Tax=Thermocladium modestius TaxID=62609 RepID=A0A830GXJ9_9CREN|nr:hypothetical protein [Thermocladium modestius]GGP22215.1 hypothetical protein GCM10007981_17380 [Thermocladium modestius]
MSARRLRLQLIAGIGYSFVVSALTLGLELVADIFYPVRLVLSPFWAIYVGQWVDLGLIVALYALLLAFASPYGLQEGSSYYSILKDARRLAAYTLAVLAILSIAFDAYGGPLRARVGIFILINLIAGVAGGLLSKPSS